jgi:hypothetical protein
MESGEIVLPSGNFKSEAWGVSWLSIMRVGGVESEAYSVVTYVRSTRQLVT